MNLIKRILNAINWAFGLRDESHMFPTCDPVTAECWRNTMSENIPPMARQ